MRDVNLLKTKVLITTNEVVFHAPVDHELDPRTTMQSILIAERRFVKPMLGAAIYAELISAKNILVNSYNRDTLETWVNTNRPADREAIVLSNGDYVNSDEFLNVDQRILWTDYVHKITAEAVWFSALPVNRSRFTSKGVVKNFPDQIGAINTESVSVDLADLKHLIDKGLQDRIAPLMNDLHTHLCRVRYSGYHRPCECDGAGDVKVKKSSIVFGMYDDDDDCRQCGSREAREAVASLNLAGYVGGCRTEYFHFEDTAEAIINWTPERDTCHDGTITVERMNEDGDYEVIDSEAEPDSAARPSLYTVTWEGEDPVRITVT